MNISVVGTGYVGLVVGACLAETGNDVVCADVVASKIELLKRNILPIYEPGLEDLVKRNQQDGRLSFTADISAAISSADVLFVAVGTPPDEDGSADLQHVLEVAREVGKHMAREMVVVTKSTVPVGTAGKVAAEIRKSAKFPFHMCSNPEFLKEGAAVDDFMKPDRVVLGVANGYARDVMAEIYAPFVRTGNPIVFMDIASAEMTKYAANGMLATRISFMNEIANLCERVGANVDMVRKGIGSDSRIGPSFLFPGPGYGGSCFPKDVKALVRTGTDMGMELQILSAVDDVNARQKRKLGEKLREAIGENLGGMHIALWGLAFKPQTDDMRDAPSLTLIEDLLAAGATVCAHDPAAMKEARHRLGSRIQFADTNYDALNNADALVVITDWNEYRHPDFGRVKEALRKPVIVDGRNLYDPEKMREHGIRYYSMGRVVVEQPASARVGEYA
jgi:UDPglucose 6-dehydrogenase